MTHLVEVNGLNHFHDVEVVDFGNRSLEHLFKFRQ